MSLQALLVAEQDAVGTLCAAAHAPASKLCPPYGSAMGLRAYQVGTAPVMPHCRKIPQASRPVSVYRAHSSVIAKVRTRDDRWQSVDQGDTPRAAQSRRRRPMVGLVGHEAGAANYEQCAADLAKLADSYDHAEEAPQRDSRRTKPGAR
jgi:hypothetical protein